jgi:hypothetical protein
MHTLLSYLAEEQQSGMSEDDYVNMTKVRAFGKLIE